MEKKKSNKKRTLATILATIGIVSVTSVFAMNASANNYQDTEGMYSYTSSQYSYTDSARLKTDSSYSYQKCLWTDFAYYSWVYGSWQGGNQTLSTTLYDLKDPISGRATPWYTFNNGTTYYMVNWVNENNIPYAGMMFAVGGNCLGLNYIQWSPDSI